MSDLLLRIKRAVLAGRFEFSEKARLEMWADGLIDSDVVESIVNCVAIYKTIRSTSPLRHRRREYLHIIIGPTLVGLPIYTKGKLVEERGVETYYFLVSAKQAV